MDLRWVMEQKSFVVVGDTLNEGKFACKIKRAMADKGYGVQCVGSELSSINDTEGEIDVIDLCIRPDRGLALMKECAKAFKGVVIQPGAQSPELIDWLKAQEIPYIESCLLVGLRMYGK